MSTLAAGAAAARAACFDPDRDAGPVPSPCVDVCRISPITGCCEGCARRPEEIGAWPGLDEAGKRAVWRRIGQRRAAAAAGTPR